LLSAFTPAAPRPAHTVEPGFHLRLSMTRASRPTPQQAEASPNRAAYKERILLKK
jgi:hypothetical protein